MGPFKGATDKAARNFLFFTLGPTARIALRPSGTEPKAKAYVEACSPPCPPHASTSDWQALCRETNQRVETLAAAFLEMCKEG